MTEHISMLQPMLREIQNAIADMNRDMNAQLENLEAQLIDLQEDICRVHLHLKHKADSFMPPQRTRL